MIATLLLACAYAPLTHATPPPVRRDVAYGPSPSSRLDLYRSPDPAPQQLVVFVHGGSWVGGDKDNLALAPGLIDWFLTHDFAVAAPNFRRPSKPGTGQSPHDPADMATDLAAAIGWLHDHHEELGLQPTGVVLMGFSSGAHLTALVASDPSYLAAHDLPRSHLDAAISLDVHAYDVPLALQLMEGSDIADNERLIRSVFGTSRATQWHLSPAAYVDAGVPRSLLVSAEPASSPTTKGWIARQTSATHAARLREVGVDAQHLHLDDATHSDLVMGFGRPGHAVTEAVEEWLLDDGT